MKISLTDGIQRVFGIEYRLIASLSVNIPPGTKVAVQDAEVRNGTLWLTSDCVCILGGQVDELMQAETLKRHELERRKRPAYLPEDSVSLIPFGERPKEQLQPSSQTQNQASQQILPQSALTSSAANAPTLSQQPQTQPVFAHVPNCSTSLSTRPPLQQETVTTNPRIRSGEIHVVTVIDGAIFFCFLCNTTR